MTDRFTRAVREEEALQRDPASIVVRDVEIAREGLAHKRDEHHRRCTTKKDEGCDCYARFSVDYHQALDRIAAHWNEAQSRLAMDAIDALLEAETALAAALRESETLREALSNLRETADLFHCGHVGLPEFADAMDKAYAALYPSAALAGGGDTP